MSASAQTQQFPFHAPQLTALVLALREFSPASKELGYAYLESGRVHNLRIEPPTLRAEVRGTELYGVNWEWDKDLDEWDHECTCPINFGCKHAFATACVLLLTVPEGLRQIAGINNFVAAMPVPAVPVEAYEPASDDLPKRSGVIEELRRESNTWRKRDLVQKILSRGPNRYLNAYDQPFVAIVSETDPDLMCWQLATEIARQSEGWVPPELTVYRDRPELELRMRDRARKQLLTDLMSWATDRRSSAAASRNLRFVVGLRSGWNDRIGLTIEARLTSSKLRDEPRALHQLQQLRSDAQRVAGMLPTEQFQALEAFLDSAQRYSFWSEEQRAPNEVVRALLEQAPSAVFIHWNESLPPELAARAGITPGAAVRLGREPVRILPSCVAHEGQIQLELGCLWRDRTQPLRQVVHIERASSSSRGAGFVIADGFVWLVNEEPPEELLADFQAAGAVRIEREDWPQVIGPLAVRFPHVRDELASHTRIHQARCVVALALREDDWLQARVFAHTGPAPWRPGDDWAADVTVFEFVPPGQWRKLNHARELIEGPSAYAQVDDGGASAAPAAEAIAEQPGDRVAELKDDEVWAEAPDPAGTQPALDWVATVTAGGSTAAARQEPNTQPPDFSVGWWTLAVRKRMEQFASLWDERPRAVTYVGNDRVRRLLSRSQGLRPRLRVAASGIDWFSVTADWEAEGLQLTEADLARLRAANSRFVKLPSGWVRKDEAEERDEMSSLLADLGIEIGSGPQKLTLWQMAQIGESSLNALEQLGVDAETNATIARLREGIAAFEGIPALAIPAGFRGELRPYQQRGLEFLAYVSALGLGAILADDMGLGKTLQALLWLLHLRADSPRGGPALVVCPTSVMHNWVRESERFTPELRVLALGSGTERHELRKDLRNYDLVVTNYALLRRDIEAWREIKLRAVIMDEAQNIKNPDAAVSRAALELQSKYRLALTGTPLENRPLDLWSIMNFVNPGYLGNRTEFSGRFDRLDASPHSRNLLAAKLRPVLLRRMKKEVAPDLPDRIEERLDCELTEGQRQLYLAELRRSRKLVDDLSAEPGGVRQNKIEILAALTRLRQICCHPALGGGEASLGSGKFDAVFELLEPLLSEGHKVLLFSQFVQCLKLLEKEIKARGIGYHMLTGQSTKREKIVRDFQEDPDPCVFLISLKAGGTGLNLTAASYVVVFDPWWNPAVEAQAIDRTHRIGQDRTVIAYKMIATGTIEEKIWQLQNQKAAMVRDILGEDGFARSLTQDDLQYLLAETPGEIDD